MPSLSSTSQLLSQENTSMDFKKSTNAIEAMLKLPPRVLKLMGLDVPKNKQVDSLCKKETSALMVQNLFFGREKSTSNCSEEQEPLGLSPVESFAISHEYGPHFFFRDNFLGSEAAAKISAVVQNLHKNGFLKTANMGRGSSKVFFLKTSLFI